MAEREAASLSREWFRARRKFVALGGTYDEVVYDPELEKDYIQLTRISVEVEGGNPDQIRVYVRGHGYPHWVGEEVEPEHDRLYWIEWPTYLVPGEQLVARFTGADAGDVLHLLVEGWIYDPPLILTNINVTVVPGVV